MKTALSHELCSALVRLRARTHTHAHTQGRRAKERSDNVFRMHHIRGIRDQILSDSV